jgi:hypothetical protein
MLSTRVSSHYSAYHEFYEENCCFPLLHKLPKFWNIKSNGAQLWRSQLPVQSLWDTSTTKKPATTRLLSKKFRYAASIYSTSVNIIKHFICPPIRQWLEITLEERFSAHVQQSCVLLHKLILYQTPSNTLYAHLLVNDGKLFLKSDSAHMSNNSMCFCTNSFFITSQTFNLTRNHIIANYNLVKNHRCTTYHSECFVSCRLQCENYYYSINP